MYFAISLITENVDFNIKVFENVKAIENVKEKINVVYKQIKKNEKAPKTPTGTIEVAVFIAICWWHYVTED